MRFPPGGRPCDLDQNRSMPACAKYGAAVRSARGRGGGPGGTGLSRPCNNQVNEALEAQPPSLGNLGNLKPRKSGQSKKLEITDGGEMPLTSVEDP